MHRQARVRFLLAVLLAVITRHGEPAAAAPWPLTPPRAKLVYAFPNDTFIENLHVLPRSGHILLTTLSSGRLLSIDPDAANPSPRALAQLGTATGLTGIAELGRPGLGVYAVTGGTHAGFRFAPGSMAVFVVLVVPLRPNHPPSAVVVSSIPFPDTTMMNGLAPLVDDPFTVLSADSLQGRILRINTVTRVADVAFADAALSPGGNPAMPLGINGLRVVGDYLYFTNSGQGTYGRVPIDRLGNKTGNAQILATLGSSTNLTFAFDDFNLDRCGYAYVSLHDSQVVKITPDGVLSAFAGGPGAVPAILSPTSVALANDGASIYVTTGGLGTMAPPGGQLLNYEIPTLC
ncbi:hypothetical protein B0H66DRAFT_555664 [Apodospora peruviana]|uniref:Uncharacterized protein n=1 Tax=Apodospora peruviana TaxID=516989 RepID=A0AAE0IDJ7_9PEZI|nr:hypothetical protein B0H66DRAFT_555664 [Apodospora peruviana]